MATDPNFEPQGNGPVATEAPPRPTPPSRLPQPNDLPENDFDPANRSLAEALRLSFFVLQLAMVALIGVYLLSGFHTVPEQARGLRLLFGRIQDPEPLTPAQYFTWPYPLGQMVTVRTAPQTVELQREFWVGLSPTEQGMRFRDLAPSSKYTLRPGEDGSVLTADMNLAHTRWRVQYQIIDARRAEESISTARGSIERLVRKAVERGVVHGAAATPLDDIVQTRDLLNSRVRRHAQEVLDRIDAGIQITSVAYDAYPPRPVLDAYESVNQAMVEAGQKREEAERVAQQRLNETAGAAYRQLSALIADYEATLELAQADPALFTQAEAVLAEIDDVLMSGQVGGKVAGIIDTATADRANTITAYDSHVRVFRAWQEEYSSNPDLTTNLLWAQMMHVISGRNFEWFMLPPESMELLNLELTRDPARKRRMQAERYQEQFRGVY